MQCRPPAATLLVLCSLSVLGIALFAAGVGALVPEGYMFYQANFNNTLIGDNFSGTDFTASNETVQQIGAIPLWIEAQWSRHRNESLVVTYDSANDINVVVVNMTNRSGQILSEVTASGPATTSRTADVAYTSATGLGLAVWDTSTADQTISYNTWNGTTLSGAGTINLQTGSTSRRFLRLVPDPRSDYIMLIYNDAVNGVGAALWNGSTFTNATNITGTTGAVPASRRPMDFGWYSDGDGIIFYGNGTGVGGTVSYRSFDRSTGGWSSETLALNTGAVPQALDACANPNNNYVGVITTDSLSDANAFIWNGTAVETSPARPAEDGGIETAGHNSKCEWESSGLQAVFTFIDSNALSIDYFHYNLSADLATRVWSTNTMLTTQNTGNIAADDIENLKLRADPRSDTIMITFKDLLFDIRTAIWTGNGIAASTANFVIEGVSSTANAQSYEFVWNRLLSEPPAIVTPVNDSSNTTSPTDEGQNVTFRVNASDPEGQQYTLLVCGSVPGEIGGNCTGQELCRSASTSSQATASCQHNTSGEANETTYWFGYVCDTAGSCSLGNAVESPYNVNHQPVSAPYLSTLVPNATTGNITCFGNSTDNDTGDTNTTVYTWWLRNESSGSFGMIAGQGADHLNNTHYDSNDQVICQVLATDNHGFAGIAVNTSMATVQNGTLSIDASIDALGGTIYQNVTITANCSVANGDSENVSLFIEDNRTGSFTESASSGPDSIWANQSNQTIGPLANASSTTYQFAMHFGSAGAFDVRAQCRAADTNTTLANSTTWSLAVTLFAINASGPANDTALDRDGTQADPDVLTLAATLPAYIPDGVLVEFRANLTDPASLAQTDVLFGSNTSVGGAASLSYNASGTTYAGNWTWYVVNANATVGDTRRIAVYGQLAAAFSDATASPGGNYTLNGTADWEANVTSLGSETPTELNTTYNVTVTSRMNNSLVSSSVTMTYQNPAWNTSQALLNIVHVGPRNVSVDAAGAFWYQGTDARTTLVYSFMNVTENITVPDTVGLNTNSTFTCRVRDQVSQQPVIGATVYFTANGTSVGTNVTNASGHADLTFSSASYGTFQLACEVFDEFGGYYMAGGAPFGNATLLVTSVPPSFATPVQDYSDDADPTNESDNVTFTANATDAEFEQWTLVICGGTEGITGTACDGTEICRSGLASSGTNATCAVNTSGEASQYIEWWAYACDISEACSTVSNSSSPYEVNHAPTASPTLSPPAPTVASTLTCSANAGDLDIGDTVSNAYAWYRRNESAGSFALVSGQTSNQLTNLHFDSNDQLACQATPTDNHGFGGDPANSSVVTIANGTLSAAASLASGTVFRTLTTTLYANCTVSDGDGESVTLVIQDDRTGPYAQSSTTPAAVYVSASSVPLGRVAGTSATQSITVYTQTAGTYNFRAQCQASDTNVTVANSSAQQLDVVLDTTPPVISNVAVDAVSSSATITWDTDDLSDSQIDYGTTPTLGSSVYSPTDVTSHSLVATNLQSLTNYYYNITSCNIDGYCATLGPSSFTTPSSDEEATPVTKGFCTGTYVERAPDSEDGKIKKGDVFEFYCELPTRVHERQDFTVTLTNSEKQVQKTITTPDPVYGEQVVLYP